MTKPPLRQNTHPRQSATTTKPLLWHNIHTQKQEIWA